MSDCFGNLPGCRCRIIFEEKMLSLYRLKFTGHRAVRCPKCGVTARIIEGLTLGTDMLITHGLVISGEKQPACEFSRYKVTHRNGVAYATSE